MIKALDLKNCPKNLFLNQYFFYEILMFPV